MTITNKPIILNLLNGAVPEKASETTELWEELGHEFEVTQSGVGVTLEATRKRILTDTKTIDFFWLVGFVTWKSIEVYSPAVVCSTVSNSTIDDVINVDDEFSLFEFEYKCRMQVVEKLLAASETSEIDWPSDIIKPTEDRDSLENDELKATFDLVCLALAFAIFHELRHVMFRREGVCPKEGREEEMMCDVWARNYMTSNLDAYATSQGNSFEEIERKRASGIALAAIIIHAMTSKIASWGCEDYPPVWERMQALMEGYGQKDNSLFWMYVCCLLVSVFREQHMKIDINAGSYRELTLKLLDRLSGKS